MWDDGLDGFELEQEVNSIGFAVVSEQERNESQTKSQQIICCCASVLPRDEFFTDFSSEVTGDDVKG